MTKRIVDGLETIEIDAEHGKLPAAEAFKRPDEMFPKQNPVRQIGE